MPPRALDRLTVWLPGIAFIALVLAGIEYASQARLVNPVLVPPPSEVAKVLWRILASGEVVGPLAETLGLLFVSYGIACAAGIGLGIVMGYYRPIYNVLEPLAEILRTIPKPVLLPPLMLFLGLGAPMKIFIVAIAAFFPVLINTMQAVRSVDPTLIDTARTFSHGDAAILGKVLFPASTPLIMAGMRVSLGLALILVVLSEMLAGTGGLGYLIIGMQRSFQVRETFAWLVILSAVGISLTMIFDWIERKLVFWNSRSN
jgi:ABC-type nitrate/sulfonate/bicarbonate transport system permease component